MLDFTWKSKLVIEILENIVFLKSKRVFFLGIGDTSAWQSDCNPRIIARTLIGSLWSKFDTRFKATRPTASSFRICIYLSVASPRPTKALLIMRTMKSSRKMCVVSDISTKMNV